MAHPTKIATCHYCGTRAALVLRGKDRHELACSGCGAPLHDLKIMPAEPRAKPKREYGISHAPKPKKGKPERKIKKSKRKKRFGDLFEDAFDFLEDIFD